MIEDLGNIDQMTFLVDYLFRAGATIAPLRPVGHQTNEVVMDNDDPGVKFVGRWTDGKGPVYFGNAGNVPYRQASTSTKETAYARYTAEDPGSRFLSGLRLDELGRRSGDRSAVSREPRGRSDGSDRQSSPRGQRAGVPGNVLLRCGHQRIGGYQQSLQ